MASVTSSRRPSSRPLSATLPCFRAGCCGRSWRGSGSKVPRSRRGTNVRSTLPPALRRRAPAPMPTVRYGTSSWSEKSWVGPFYPAVASQATSGAVHWPAAARPHLWSTATSSKRRFFQTLQAGKNSCPPGPRSALTRRHAAKSARLVQTMKGEVMNRLAMLCASVVALVLQGCDGVKEAEVGGPVPVKVVYENPQTYTVNVPSGTCWKLTWKNSEGEEVGSTCGNGPAAGSVPPGVSNHDFAIIDCANCSGTQAVYYPVLQR